MSDESSGDHAKSWPVRHFTISDTGRGPVWLLRRIADAIAERGDINVQDITFSQEIEGPNFWSRMTVYYSLEEDT